MNKLHHHQVISQLTSRMSKALLFMVCMACAAEFQAQENYADEPRYISVTGSTEVEVQADIIKLEVILKAFSELSISKFSLENIEKRLIKVIEKNNIDADQMVYTHSPFNWYNWWTYNDGNLKQKAITLTLSADTDLTRLMSDLDFKGIDAVRIAHASSSALPNLSKELKASALKAAKEQAQYLLGSIDEKLGRVVSIQELPQDPYYELNPDQRLVSQKFVNTPFQGREVASVSGIKLRYEVIAQFEIE